MNIGILDWLNENSKGDYPMSKDIGIKGVIVDASFIQFDDFVPVLKTIKVQETEITFTIQFDKATTTVTVTKSEYTFGIVKKVTLTGNRYVGSLTFGNGIATLFADYLNKTVTVNAAFSPITVCSILSTSGVYSIETFNDVVVIDTDDSGVATLFFTINGNTVKWNAVGLPAEPEVAINPLKTINGAAAKNNALTLKDSTLIKFTPNFGALVVSLVNSPLNDNIAPTSNYA